VWSRMEGELRVLRTAAVDLNTVEQAQSRALAEKQGRVREKKKPTLVNNLQRPAGGGVVLFPMERGHSQEGVESIVGRLNLRARGKVIDVAYKGLERGTGALETCLLSPGVTSDLPNRSADLSQSLMLEGRKRPGSISSLNSSRGCLLPFRKNFGQHRKSGRAGKGGGARSYIKRKENLGTGESPSPRRTGPK